MKGKTIQLTIAAFLIIFSMSCFVYVNTAQIKRVISVNTLTDNSKMYEEKDSKMLDLALVQGVFILVQRFIPAK